MFIIYALATHLALIMVLPLLALLRPRLRRGTCARFGRLPRGCPGQLRQPVVWFHGASAGDILALEPIIRELRRQKEGLSLVATAVTDSGLQAAAGLEWLQASTYAPYDLFWAVRSVVAAFRPKVLVLQQAELWPALLREARRAGASIVLVNGRLGEGRLFSYRLLFLLAGNQLRRLDLLCMRDESEAGRALRLGARPELVRVTGDTKFDALCPDAPSPERLFELRRALGLEDGDILWLAGSTHRGEEKILLQAFVRLRPDHPRLRLVLAPRYLARSGKVAALAAGCGLAAARRSRGVGREPVVVLDSMGELRQIYWLADVVFVGGSLVRRGGHNLLEPAVCGKPVLFGPHLENFRSAVELLAGRGGIQVADGAELQQAARRLLENPAERERLGGLAREAVLSRRGAARRCAEAIAEMLPAEAGHGA